MSTKKRNAKATTPVVEKAPVGKEVAKADTKTSTPVEVKDTVKSVSETKVPEKKTEEKVVTAVKEEKAAPAKKAPVKKAAPKKTAIKETMILQYLGKEIHQEEILKQVKAIWTKELKKKAGDMKSVTIYLKPEENTAYYVINDDVTGSIAL